MAETYTMVQVLQSSETYATVQATQSLLKKFQVFDNRYSNSKIKLLQRILTGKDKNGQQVDVPRELISPAQLFEQRLRGKDDDKAYLRSYAFDTSLCVVPNPDIDEIKLVHRSPLLLDETLSDETLSIQGGTMPVSREQYHAATGLVLTSNEVTEFRNNHFGLPKKREEIFEFAVEGDNILATEYKKDVCTSLSLGFNKVMGIFLSAYLPTIKSLRFLNIGPVYNHGEYSRSCADARELPFSPGHMIGVAPDAPVEIGLHRTQENGSMPDLETVMDKLSSTGLFGDREIRYVREQLAPLYLR